jgi:DNA polymerase III subunit gamma/tau
VVTLEQVNKAWKQIRVVIKAKSLSLEGLLNSGRLLDVKENVLIIGFQSEILRSKADTPEQMKITRQAITEVMKVELGVRCVVTNAKHSTPPDVKSDGMVAAALRHGGEIVN